MTQVQDNAALTATQRTIWVAAAVHPTAPKPERGYADEVTDNLRRLRSRP